MAIYHGKLGIVEFDTTALFAIQNWNLSETAETFVTTAKGSATGWNTHDDGLTDFTASAEGFGEIGDTQPDYPALIGKSAVLQLYVDATKHFLGTAILTGITETAVVGEGGKLSYEFVGNDADGLSFA